MDTKWERRTKLLRILSISSHYTRHYVVSLIEPISIIDTLQNGWPELLPFIARVGISEDKLLRETGVFLIYILFDYIPRFLMSQTDTLFSLLEQTVRDTESTKARIYSFL